MKKIPYGICNYRKLQEEGYVYVDKTSYLEKLEDVGSTLVYLRPGRFGKTLFTSMMYYYYDIKSEALFDSLFKNTYVYKHPTVRKNKYYILKLDFSNIETYNKDESSLDNEFTDKIRDGITYFNDYYKVNFEIDKTLSANMLIRKFILYFNSLKLEEKLYIIIDEYDNFTNAILEGEGLRFKNLVGNEGIVKNFYSTIKEYVGLGIVDRVFMTGICPITLDSMTTGFNIALDISRDIRFTTMIGLTHDEVKGLLGEVEEEKQEELYQLMVSHYDGYLFNKEQEEKSFNATLVMYFLNYYYRLNQIPDSLIDVNIAFNYGKVENLIKLYQNNYYQDILNELFTTDTVSGILKEKFNLEYDFTKDDIISLLYYFGYLTIGKENILDSSIQFKIPNQVMKETYNNYFVKILSDMNITFDDNHLRECYKELIFEGKITKITNYIKELLSKADNRDFIKFDEKYIKLMYFTLLCGNPNFNTYTEYPTSNGFIDVMLFKNGKYSKYDIMIELKYLKKSDYRKNKKLLLLKKEEAKNQLESYAKDERIPKNSLKKYIVIFIGEKLELIEEV